MEKLKIGRFGPSERMSWPAAAREKRTALRMNHFTSGLWAMFHVLSVSKAPTRPNPYAIMEGIHSFAANFLR